MQMTIKKWGNSLATRIPKAIVDSVGFLLDQDVKIEAVDGKIVITPSRTTKEYNLIDLLGQCEPETMSLDQEDEEWINSPPVGREI